ncbi:hypothetical protein R1T16_12995 [Flavobacterium sp. DG1-102-2]|uniref:hypothetical protein n=1 Tax=Flavobacterium sp. DG1-102-2 TaxID=3081663 RepID=UPI00294A27DE|nr:hypothetical protein [Flavobacterium sp. DG1-102-2]MDV6169345.1 hypothetical protein [Flavobacterium sp. DG1-102-2]
MKTKPTSHGLHLSFNFLGIFLTAFIYSPVSATTKEHRHINDCDSYTLIKPTDTVEARRDEYFKEVRIIIEDEPASVSINKPYEKLSNRKKNITCLTFRKRKKQEVYS